MGKYSTNSSYSYAPYKFVIYGPEGIGKTTLAAQFPDPVFLDTEGSTRYYDVRRIIQPNGQSTPSSWQMLMEMAAAVRDGEIPCKTFVVDSLDWAEDLCAAAVCSKNGKSGIEDFGYGKGYVYLAEEFGRFLNLLNEIYERGINVVCTAHASMQRIELPEETGAYDHWGLKLEKKTAPLVKEWADIVLFCNYKTIVIKGANPMEKNKAAGGKRVMYTNHTPWWDAKNRFGLAEELPMDFKSIASLFLYEQPVTAPQATELAAPAPAPATAGEQIRMEMPKQEDPAPQPSGAEFERQSREEKPLPFVMEESNPLPEGVPKALADLMAADHVTPEQLQQAVASKGYYPANTPIENYDPQFVSGCLVACWDSVKQMIH